MKHKEWYDYTYRYICCNCEYSLIRRASSGGNGAARRCPKCRSVNILREDHPILTIQIKERN